MPEVNVEIDGKKYRMACEDGEEEHLLGLAEQFSRQVAALRSQFGEIGDNRLIVMAGIAALDAQSQSHHEIAELKADIAQLTTAGRELTLEAEELERNFAKRLADAARKVEAIATAIDETGAAPAE